MLGATVDLNEELSEATVLVVDLKSVAGIDKRLLKSHRLPAQGHRITATQHNIQLAHLHHLLSFLLNNIKKVKVSMIDNTVNTCHTVKNNVKEEMILTPSVLLRITDDTRVSSKHTNQMLNEMIEAECFRLNISFGGWYRRLIFESRAKSTIQMIGRLKERPIAYVPNGISTRVFRSPVSKHDINSAAFSAAWSAVHYMLDNEAFVGVTYCGEQAGTALFADLLLEKLRQVRS